jgi:hypothetical protein
LGRRGSRAAAESEAPMIEIGRTKAFVLNFFIAVMNLRWGCTH